jgi:purine nucleosidase
MRRRTFLASCAAGIAAAATPPLSLIFDTDIGSDVDDAIALAILVNSPEIRLAGVTTVFRNPWRRAQYARRFLDAMRRPDVPCCAGCAIPIAPVPSAPLPRGYGARLRELPLAAGGNDEGLGTRDTPAISPQHAVDFLIDSTRAASGPRHILVVGPQTNLAMALIKDPSLPERLDAVTLMGYNFEKGIDPYNVGNDLGAARHVLASGVPLRVLPVEIGIACQMSAEEYSRAMESTCPHMKILAGSMRQWVQFVRNRPRTPIPDYLPRPYDSLAALTITHPGLFRWKRGTITLERGDDPTSTRHTFRESADGPHQIVTGVDREKAMALHMERLLACRT